MITTDILPGRVEMRAYGTLTLSDCQAFENISDIQLAQGAGPLDMMIDLRSMTDCSLDVTLEELRFVRKHSNTLRRVAVLTDDQIVTWNAWLSQCFTEADIRVFDSEHAARRWLEGHDLLEDEADAAMSANAQDAATPSSRPH